MKQTATQIITGLSLLFYSWLAYADLPTPPPNDLPNGSQDWIDIAQVLGQKAGNIFLILLGAALLGGIVTGVLRSYHVSQERQESSHFFKAVGIGIVAATLGLALLYSGYQIING